MARGNGHGSNRASSLTRHRPLLSTAVSAKAATALVFTALLFALAAPTIALPPLEPRNNGGSSGALTPVCPGYPVSTDGRCGKLFGWTRCPDGQCCSQWNWCSAADSPDNINKYCGTGCQLGYGACTAPSSNSSSGYSMPDIFCKVPPASSGTWSLLTTATATFTPTQSVLPSCSNYPASTNGRCGAAFGFSKCPSYSYKGVSYPSCCSKYNFCWDPNVGFDQRSAYCATENCQAGFGACDDKGTQTVIPCRIDIAPTSATPTYTYITVHGTATPTSTCAPNCLTTVTITVTSGSSTPTKTGDPTTSKTTSSTKTASTITTTPTVSPSGTTASTLTLPPDFSGTNYITATYNADPAYPQSSDGMCGPDHGNTRCGTMDDPGCCSSESQCYQPVKQGSFNDTSAALTPCGPGCQRNFGICFAAFIKKGQRCGPGLGSCPNNICCGASGYCQDDGATDGVAWCGCGCQVGYGKCFDGYGPDVCNATLTTTSLTATPTPTAIVLGNLDIETGTNLRCGAGVGANKRCPNNACCSAASFCENDGNTDGFAWCGCGCQFGYGNCFLYAPGTCPGVETSSTAGLTVLPWPTATAKLAVQATTTKTASAKARSFESGGEDGGELYVGGLEFDAGSLVRRWLGRLFGK